MSEKYIRIPNKLVYDKSYNTIIKNIDKKSIMVVYAISKLSLFNDNNICYCSIDIIRIVLGLKDNQKTIKSIKDILIKLNSINYINISNVKNISDISKSESLVINLNLLTLDLNNKAINYFKLYNNEFDCITKSNYSTKIKYGMLVLFCFYAATVKNDNIGRTLDMRSPLTTHHNYESIQKNTGLSNDSICKYNDILQELNLIKILNPGMFQKTNENKSVLKSGVNIIALCRIGNEEDIDNELNNSANQYKHIQLSNGWKLIK